MQKRKKKVNFKKLIKKRGGGEKHRKMVSRKCARTWPKKGRECG